MYKLAFTVLALVAAVYADNSAVVKTSAVMASPVYQQYQYQPGVMPVSGYAYQAAYPASYHAGGYPYTTAYYPGFAANPYAQGYMAAYPYNQQYYYKNAAVAPANAYHVV